MPYNSISFPGVSLLPGPFEALFIFLVNSPESSRIDSVTLSLPMFSMKIPSI